MQKFWYIPVLFIMIGMILVAGCTSNQGNGLSGVQTTSSPSVSPTLVSPSASLVLQTVDSGSVTDSQAQQSDQIRKPADPSVQIVGMKKGSYGIGNCTMAQLLPNITNDPDYGLNSVKNYKLIFLSTGDFNRIIREYTEKKDSFYMCYGIPETPYWDIVQYNAIITARNANPTMYNVTTFVRFRGIDGPEYTTSMMLNPGQAYPMTIYIPIRSDQIQEIQTIDFRFKQID